MSSSSHAGAPLDDDAAWRECASYEERFIRPAVLEFQPSGIRLELEQSGGDSSGFDFDQVTVWPAGVVMARALQHPEIAIFIAGKRVLELGSGCGVAGLVAAAMGAAHVSLTDLPAVLLVVCGASLPRTARPDGARSRCVPFRGAPARTPASAGLRSVAPFAGG